MEHLEHPSKICVRYMPAVYAYADLESGEDLADAKRLLKPYVDRGLRCCVIYRDYALYLEQDGTQSTGPLPNGGLSLRLKPLAD